MMAGVVAVESNLRMEDLYEYLRLHRGGVEVLFRRGAFELDAASDNRAHGVAAGSDYNGLYTVCKYYAFWRVCGNRRPLRTGNVGAVGARVAHGDDSQ